MLVPQLNVLNLVRCLRDDETGELLFAYAPGNGELGLVWRKPDQQGTAAGRSVKPEEAQALLNAKQARDTSWNEWKLETSSGLCRFVRVNKPTTNIPDAIR